MITHCHPVSLGNTPPFFQFWQMLFWHSLWQEWLSATNTIPHFPLLANFNIHSVPPARCNCSLKVKSIHAIQLWTTALLFTLTLQWASQKDYQNQLYYTTWLVHFATARVFYVCFSVTTVKPSAPIWEPRLHVSHHTSYDNEVEVCVALPMNAKECNRSADQLHRAREYWVELLTR